MHPTKERLIRTTVEMLDEGPPEKVHVEEVLTRSGVSRGSLYHHFDDFGDLIEAGLIVRFSATVDESIDALTQVLLSSSSREEAFARMAEVTRQLQSPDRTGARFERARLLGMAGSSDRFRAALGQEQQRLTEGLADLFREAQSRGWMNAHFDPTAAAVLVQAYTLGYLFDEISPSPMEPEAWAALISRLLDRVFG